MPLPLLDNKVHLEYAEKLLPRAVGYSAALIDYFFRGRLGVEFVQNGIRVRNQSAEDMTYYMDPATKQTIGAIEVFYDDANGYRHLLATYHLATSPTPTIAPSQASDIIEFAFPPDNVTPGRYIIVFRGRLGNEDGAVAGRVYSPTVYYIARLDGRDKIMRVDAGGGPSSVVYDTQDASLNLLDIALSPDSSALVMMVKTPASVHNASIVHHDVVTGITTTITEGNGPDWSPSGNRIVFSRELGRGGYTSADEQLFVRDIATGAETQLTDGAFDANFHPAWSPDGTTVAFTSFNSIQPGCSNDFAIDVINADGSSRRRISCSATGGTVDHMPAWSPDGQRIVFSRYTPEAGYAALYTIDVGGGEAKKLNGSSSGFDERSPAWSPDGHYIAASVYDGNADIRLLDPAGGGYLRNLTGTNPDYDALPVFAK